MKKKLLTEETKRMQELSGIITENHKEDGLGINLRSLLDGELAMAVRGIDLNIYQERSDFIEKIEKRLKECDWISMSDGTTFEKTFTPGGPIKTNQYR
jgi:hypothetical protein